MLQGYGATETCIVSANRPEDNHVGSVGLPFPGIEVEIAADGEILLRGPNVMQGYYGQPEATAAVLQDGWFSTGDVGHLDDAGRLYITDRKKDLFKLSNGKYVAPQLIESLLKQSEFVSQVVVDWRGPQTTCSSDRSRMGSSETGTRRKPTRSFPATGANSVNLRPRSRSCSATHLHYR